MYYISGFFFVLLFFKNVLLYWLWQLMAGSCIPIGSDLFNSGQRIKEQDSLIFLNFELLII